MSDVFIDGAEYRLLMHGKKMQMADDVDINDREALIAWLVRNDPNGCYADEDAIAEWGQPHTLEILQECYRGVTDG